MHFPRCSVPVLILAFLSTASAANPWTTSAIGLNYIGIGECVVVNSSGVSQDVQIFIVDSMTGVQVASTPGFANIEASESGSLSFQALHAARRDYYCLVVSPNDIAPVLRVAFRRITFAGEVSDESDGLAPGFRPDPTDPVLTESRQYVPYNVSFENDATVCDAPGGSSDTNTLVINSNEPFTVTSVRLGIDNTVHADDFVKLSSIKVDGHTLFFKTPELDIDFNGGPFDVLGGSFGGPDGASFINTPRELASEALPGNDIEIQLQCSAGVDGPSVLLSDVQVSGWRRENALVQVELLDF